MAKNLTIGSKYPKEAVFLDQIGKDVDGPIIVMISRKWDVNNIHGRFMSTDFLLSDERSNVMCCTAKANIAHCFVKKLEEGLVYSIKDFIVHPNKDEYRILKESPYMIELHGSTYVKKVVAMSNGFNRYPFEFSDFENIKPTEKKYLIDVIGYVRTLGKPVPQRAGSTTLDFYLINRRGDKVRVTLWGNLGDEMVQKRSHVCGVYYVILTSMSAKYYNNFMCLSSSSSTIILDSHEIPALKELRSQTREVNIIDKGYPAIQPTTEKGTIEQLLRLGRERKKDAVTFSCEVEITNIRTRNSWYYFACTSGKCKKGVSRKQGNFWCESCNKPISFPRPSFRLQIEVKDDSGEIVVAMFDETAERLVNTTAKALLEETSEATDEDSVLPHALENLITTKHVLEIKSTTYYEHGSFESFTCSRILPAQISVSKKTLSTKFQELKDTMHEDNADEGDDTQISSVKALKRCPTITTPSKPVGRKKMKKYIEEDSDSEVEVSEVPNE